MACATSETTESRCIDLLDVGVELRDGPGEQFPEGPLNERNRIPQPTGDAVACEDALPWPSCGGDFASSSRAQGKHLHSEASNSMDESLSLCLAVVLGKLDGIRSELAEIIHHRFRTVLGQASVLSQSAQEQPAVLQTGLALLSCTQPTPTDTLTATQRAQSSVAIARAAAAAASHSAEETAAALRTESSWSEKGWTALPREELASGSEASNGGDSLMREVTDALAKHIRQQGALEGVVAPNAATFHSEASQTSPRKNHCDSDKEKQRCSVVTDTGGYEKVQEIDHPIVQKYSKPKQKSPFKREHADVVAVGDEGPLFIEARPRSFLEKLVSHWLFDTASAILVFLSTLLLGLETEYVATHDGQHSEVLAMLQKWLLVSFAVELVLRIGGLRSRFLCSKSDRTWNAFDAFIVVIGLLEWALASSEQIDAVSSQSRGGKAIRVARLLRILKCVRLGRLMRYANTFRQIVYSLQASVRTLAWTLSIVFLFLYSFAIFLCQATTDYLMEMDGTVDTSSSQYRIYGTVPHALLTLYKTFTGGENWGALLDPLAKMHWMYSVAFLAFITLNFFGVLNVVAAIFVESTLQSQQHHKELLMHDKQVKQLMVVEHLKEIFASIDQRAKGSISAEEMEFILADPEQNLYLQSIDITASDARVLFQLLDQDGNGEISIDEFCNGCLRLKGEAKSMDIHCMIHNTHLLIVRTKRIMDFLDQAMPKQKEQEPFEKAPITSGGNVDVPNSPKALRS